MTTGLTQTHVLSRLADYRELVDRWLDGVLSDEDFIDIGDQLLYYNESGTKAAADIRSLAEEDEAWGAVRKEWTKAIVLHSKLDDVIQSDLPRCQHIGGDSVENIRKLYYATIVGGYAKAERLHTLLRLPPP